MAEPIEAKLHYHFVTKMLIELFNGGELSNVKCISVEPTYGYAGSIKYYDGHVHLFKGTNLGVNPVGASEISKDKGYTKFFLRQLGYNTPEGEVFLMQTYLEMIEKAKSRKGFDVLQKSASQAPQYVEQSFGYPCYAKPNFGSQGRGIVRCETKKDLEDAIVEFEKQDQKMFLVEKAIAMLDFRAVVFGNELISCYRRIPLQVVGDGTSTINQLLKEKQDSYFKRGREETINIQDQRMLSKLDKRGLSLEHVLNAGQELPLLDVSNLSMGGESEEFTNRIHNYWKKLVISITHDMGLRLCGVDIACADLENPQSDYSIFEINAAPGLDNYASSGQKQFERVRGLYKKVFNEL